MIDTFGKSPLEVARISKGLSRKAVGKALHVSDRTIYDYEHGNTSPSKLSAFVTLCKLYDLPPNKLREILIKTREEAEEELPFNDNTSLDDLEQLCCDLPNSDSPDGFPDGPPALLEELFAPVNPIEQVTAYFQDNSISEYDKIDLLVETIRQYLLHKNGF